MNFTEIFNGMVGKDFIVAFNDNFRKTDQTFLSILATLIYKVKSTDIKEFKVIDGVVSYTLEEAPEEGEEDTRSWTPVDITAWGNINGNLEDQLDLKEALDSKAALETVVEMDNILSTLRQEFNNLRDNYEDTEVDVATNTNDIADLKDVNRTKVNSPNIKGIRVSDAEFQWSLDGITWYAMQRTTSIAWGNLTGDINSQDDLMALFRDIDTSMTTLSDNVTTLSNLITTKSAEIDTISDTVDALGETIVADEAENTSKFNIINGKITDLENADTALDTKIDGHIADENNPHRVTKAQVGLGNVDNTADVNKPVSNPQRTYIDEQIAAARVDTSGLVKKSGLVDWLFVGTKDIYDELDPADTNSNLAFILYPDWRSVLVSTLSVASTNPLGSGDLKLKNVGGGKYNNLEFSCTFNSSGESSINNIPEGKYAIEGMFTEYDGGLQYTETSDFVKLTVTDGQTLNIPSSILAGDYDYLDNLVIWKEDTITIVSVSTDLGSRVLTETKTLTETPKTGYKYAFLTDTTQSADPDYVRGVALGEYEIVYEYGGTQYTTNVVVTKQNIFTPIILTQGGNE